MMEHKLVPSSAPLSRERVNEMKREAQNSLLPDEHKAEAVALCDMALRYRDVLEQEPVAQMPPRPQQKTDLCTTWVEYSDALRAHAEGLQAEVERLREAFDDYMKYEWRQRAESAERKLAEAVAALRVVILGKQPCDYGSDAVALKRLAAEAQSVFDEATK